MRRLYNNVTETSTMNIEIETLTMLTTGTFCTGPFGHDVRVENS